MIQLEQQQHGEFVGGWGGWWLTPTTYIQLAGAGSIFGLPSTSLVTAGYLVDCWLARFPATAHVHC